VDRVHQLARRLAGMDGNAGDGDHGEIGGKGLVDDLARIAAVEGIGEIDAQIGGQFRVDAAPDLFVGGEGDADRGARQVGVGDEVAGGGHDDGDARLVIGAQKRGARGGHDILADLGGQIGEILGDRVRSGASGKLIAPPL
jgi:hypothetical protein